MSEARVKCRVDGGSSGVCFDAAGRPTQRLNAHRQNASGAGWLNSTRLLTLFLLMDV